MTRAVLVLAAICAAVAAVQTWRVDRLAERAAAAEALAAGYAEGARKLDEYLVVVSRERDRWRAVAEELETVEGRDDPLNDYERAVLDRVRRP